MISNHHHCQSQLDEIIKGKFSVIVDFHVHPVFAGMTMHPGVHRISEAYYGRKAYQWKVEDFLADMDRAGIDRAVFLTACWKGQGMKERNEATARLVGECPDRFTGFAGFDPNQGQEAVEQVEYAINGLGLTGVKIIAQNVEVFYNDPRCYPIYEKIQELGIPILFHTGPSFLETRTRFGDPMTLEDVALDFPKMKIVLAHMAMHRYMEAHSLMIRHTNVYADLSFWPLHPAFRSLIPWRLLEETVPGKLLLGSDFPVGQSPSEVVQAVRDLSIGEKFRNQILGENAAGLLGF